MKLPAWAKPDHPIARRETTLWQKSIKKWRWLLALLVLLPCGCSAFCSLSALPAAFDANTPFLAVLIFLAWSIFIGIWLTSGMWAWVLGTFASVSSATVIARERETLNWGMLRLTTLSIKEIIAAKLAALGRLLLWPAAALIVLEMLGISFMALVGLVVVVALGYTSTSDIPPTLQLGLAALILGGWLPAAFYLAVTTLINLIYNSAVGLLTSSYTRTTASAVALSFAVHFGINLFIFVPIQQVITLGVQLFGGVLMLATQSPLALFVVTPLISFITPVVLQALMAAVALWWAFSQSERVTE